MKALLAAGLLAVPGTAGAQRFVEHQVMPSAIDSGVKAFDVPNIAMTRVGLPADAPLVVFMPGTGGKPEYTRLLQATIAEAGYRVIGLEYDDSPPGTALCPADPDPACFASFRRMRVYGTGRFPKSSIPVAEAIVPRLVALLKALAKAAPAESWAGYLDGDQPRWDRIIVSGASQGAGMAAYIAKEHAVRRVVLFSSPWDYTGADHHAAPWLSSASATPPVRWFAEYNAREKTAPLLRAAYAALAIPTDHVLVFDRDLPSTMREGAVNTNPYHSATVLDERYRPQWRAMFGRAGDAAP